jgi:hypothetical protein
VTIPHERIRTTRQALGVLGALAEWFDDPNKSPSAQVPCIWSPRTTSLTPGYLIRRVIEALEADEGGG